MPGATLLGGLMHSIRRAFVLSIFVSVAGLFAFVGCGSNTEKCEQASEATSKCGGLSVSGDVGSLCDLVADGDAEKGCEEKHEKLYDCQIKNKCDHTTKCNGEATAYTECTSK
jgi:hypothetical protein